MPLDTSTYSLGLLRLDGRRWNELRRMHGQMSTQAAADGSSYLEMGNTKVICTVEGPAELRQRGAPNQAADDKAIVSVELNIAGFSATDRKKQSRGDKRVSELQRTIASAFTTTLITSLFPRSTVSISLNVLAQDGSLLAACINACTLALVDAGVPMLDYLVSCTAGSTASYASNDEAADPLLDLNGTEEQELPHLTVATLGLGEKVSSLVMESRVQVSRVEGMLAVGVDGCKQVKEILDDVVRRHGKSFIKGG